ncbi:uncharacterized protein RHOBADRAFT_53102 [Rhodotorula graminis WP1]|uniref:Cyclin N-terminal domain-containing protein n=1 Tax=Rhodotorula graminis (strain WP1) TaxID=578459 RepID=A0A194S5W8_RHOGW|nr:uncharacterized protein RHOBADRAFT_53102 [Rhodotorula graminis WP1]KPV76118.1 hypothetical protein RHOBADRAFT_53102 [Rhodotorula graminis WP1]
MVASLTEPQWYYSRDELALPPSVRAGMPLSRERALRQEAVRQLWNMRDKSKDKGTFGQAVVTAAATFVHRFYMRETFQDWDHKATAAAAIFLASKAEEEPRSLKTLLSWVLDPNELADPHRANDVRQKVLAHEEAMLRVLCFDLTVRHPHWIAVSVARKAWVGEGEQEVGDKVAKVAWMILNDSLSAPLCLLYTPPVLAAAAVVLACAQLDVALPGPPPPLSEQKALHEFKVQEAEEGEEMPPFEPQVYWLELVGVEPDQLPEPVKDLADVYKLAADEFVVEEGARQLAAKAQSVVDALAFTAMAGSSTVERVPPSPSSTSPGFTSPSFSDLGTRLA